jgi:hypothetical protein
MPQQFVWRLFGNQMAASSDKMMFNFLHEHPDALFGFVRTGSPGITCHAEDRHVQFTFSLDRLLNKG